MNLFFDTSALFKLYHKEEGTDELMNFFKESSVKAIYLSEITEIEFSSAVWKKCRKGEINENLAKIIIGKFNNDSVNFRVVPQSFGLRKLAINLIAKYWSDGLRTLDSIQLASAIKVEEEIEKFFTSDKLLSDVAVKEGFSVNV
jgi:predicted nucleic acid-binding protein